MSTKDLIPGGKASGHDPKEYDPKLLAKGIKVELEHTPSRAKAQEITMDHTEEFKKLDPKSGLKTTDYYDDLDKLESKLKKSTKIATVRTLLKRADGGEEPGGGVGPEERAKIEDYVRTHRVTDDESFHKFVEGLGISPHDAEPIVYQMAHDLAKKAEEITMDQGYFINGFMDELTKEAVHPLLGSLRRGGTMLGTRISGLVGRAARAGGVASRKAVKGAKKLKRKGVAAAKTFKKTSAMNMETLPKAHYGTGEGEEGAEGGDKEKAARMLKAVLAALEAGGGVKEEQEADYGCGKGVKGR